MGLGQCRQFIVSRLFFSEDFIEQTGGILVFKLLYPFTPTAIRGDFVILLLLPVENQSGIDRRRFFVFRGDFVRLFDDADKGRAFFALWFSLRFLPEMLKYALNFLEVPSVSNRCDSKASRRSSCVAALAILGSALIIWFSA
jgi:hypothetical protein